MSENSSDSESSCGWTIISHEGSDIETLQPEVVEQFSDNASEHSTMFIEASQLDSPQVLTESCSNEDTVSRVGNVQLFSEHQRTNEVLTPGVSCPKDESSHEHGECCHEEDQLENDSHCEAVSDDSDIVTLEPPKVDEVGTVEDEEISEDVVKSSDFSMSGDLNMSFSSSSQYTFSQPETIFPSQQSGDESSNDETSADSSPVLRRRRSKRSTMSGSDCENKTAAEHSVPPEPRTLARMGSSLNRCIVLALVMAVSMGFGHFYGTIQILERQRYVENELNDMKDDLFQCQKDQEATIEHKESMDQVTEDLEQRQDKVLSLEGLMDKITKENEMLKQKHTDLKLETDDLATNLRTTEIENENLALENQNLRESLEKEEQALSSLQEELRKLREQIRNLEEKGRSEVMLTENQKLKERLKGERQKIRSFNVQKETLLSEAQFLRKELDNERQATDSLKAELEEISKKRSTGAPYGSLKSNQEIELLKVRLSELETKLNFEQQRSDLWERLYIEAKEQNEKWETGTLHQKKGQSKGEKSNANTKKNAKGTFFNSVKDTFDAMKNSTKEFVRHHKEKIKQAKEAVKENLKKFSDSVKTTFRHFKDSTRNILDKNRFRKHAEKRREESREARTVRREYSPDFEKPYPNKKAASQHEHKDSEYGHNSAGFVDEAAWKLNDEINNNDPQFAKKKGCSGVFECAHQESISLFNKILDPVTVEEFNDLMQIYLVEQVDNFHHWKELDQFINRFFPNGIFIHDQMLFTDFVNDVEDYLEDMKEYQTNTGGVFEDLDEFVYKHFFGNVYSTQYGPRKPERTPPYKDSDGNRYRKQEEKHRTHNKGEGKWNKHGRPNGRHMANVEIELGQLPFDPKY